MIRTLNIFVLDEKDSQFPPVELAHKNPNGLLAVGGDLSIPRLLNAYRHGIFPWYNDDEPILWWSPDPRAILYPEKIQISHSLRKTLKKTSLYNVTLDQAFTEVVQACAAPRAKQKTTWITSEMQHAYQQLFDSGFAHSIEVWQNKKLVGGLYGVSLGKAFFGESMFNRISDAAKIAVVWLCWQLQEWQFDFIDCQNQSRYLSTFGSETITRHKFMTLLQDTLQSSHREGKWELTTGLKL